MTEGHYAVRAEDFNRLVAERDASRAEAARLRDALQVIAAECSMAPDSENVETVRWTLRTARAALDGGDR